MKVTEVKVFPVEEEKLKAFVSIVFDHCFMVNDIKVIRGRDGLFISMPSRRKKNGRFKDVSHPLNNETRQMIERLILAEYERVTSPAAAGKERPQGSERPADPEEPEEGAAESAPAAAREAGPDATVETTPDEAEAAGEKPTEPGADEGAQEKTLEEVAELHLRDSFWNS